IEEPLQRGGQDFEYFALFYSADQLKGREVVGMDWEQAHKAIHTLGHSREAGRKAAQMLPDSVALRGALAQQPGLHDKSNILARDSHLFESIFDAPQRVGDKLERGRVENRLLYAGHEAERRLRADLTELTQEVQIQNKRMVFTTAQ